ncbi:recombinase RecT [Stenotrophomonas sp.]|uniref:recombinase RecT n=1 Tax=Stenotrophomonas sp. TaxID=69392 RepID=UPI0028A9548E|nr:recombinase RecT [Stenotrophomonas sp.]
MNLPAQQQSTVVAQPRQQFDLSPQTFEQALTFCNYLADSDLVPKDFKGKPANCLIAIQWGAELGLKPLQALQNLAIINGRPALWGDAVIALVRSSPLCESITESDDGKTATCKVKRRGEEEEVRTFSMDDARAAGLAGKQGPWTQYPKRMRQMRARAFALRDVFPDVLRGMPIAEEIMDIPASEPHRTTATVVSTEPAVYSAEEFAKNLHNWKAVIESGRKSADDLIAMVEAKAKARMTDEQRKQLRRCEALDVAEEVAEPEPAAAEPTNTDTDNGPIDWDNKEDRA